MISGISSDSGCFGTSFVRNVQAKAGKPPPAELQLDEARRNAFEAPDGNASALRREFTLFDLAARQFEQLMPAIEASNIPVE